ncbi:MAG: hypothetical protein PHH37_03735 [Paludibacter sp.]|nr:hypothetical protein [Paludibacter sp.]
MEEKEQKEINLLQLINLFFKWLKKVLILLVHFLGKLLKTTYKHIWLTVIVVAVFVAAAMYLSRPSAKVYVAEATAVCNGNDTRMLKDKELRTQLQIFDDVCKQLTSFSPREEVTSLSYKLQTPDSIAKNVVSIETFKIIDYLKDGTPDMVDFSNRHSLEDTLNLVMRDRLYMRIKTKNVAQLPKVQDALVKFFERQPILKEQFENGKKSLQNQIDICNIELNRIDSMEKVYFFEHPKQQLQFSSNTLLMGNQNKQLFYYELLRINEIKGYAMNKLLEYKHPVDFTSEFIVKPVPENSRLKYGIIGIILGYITALLISVVVDNFKNIIKYLQS